MFSKTGEINLSSSGHRYSNVDLDDPNFKRTPYEPLIAYGRSKTANILFAVAFDERHRERGVRAAAIHPGGIQTELGRYLDPARVPSMLEQMNKQLAAEGKAPFQSKTIPQGAATSVWAGVVAADEVGGQYCENCHVGDVVADDVIISAISEGVRGYALDSPTAAALRHGEESSAAPAVADARTVLIFEGVDDQLTNPVEVAKSVLRAEKAVGNEPAEIYFLFSA